MFMQCHSKTTTDMKAPVTTHGLLLLAESKLSYTNIENSGKGTHREPALWCVCVRACGVFCFLIVILMKKSHGGTSF